MAGRHEKHEKGGLRLRYSLLRVDLSLRRPHGPMPSALPPSLHCPKQIQQLKVNDIDVNHSNHCPEDLDAPLSQSFGQPSRWRDSSREGCQLGRRESP